MFSKAVEEYANPVSAVDIEESIPRNVYALNLGSAYCSAIAP